MYLIMVLLCALVVNCDGRALGSDEEFGMMLDLFESDHSSVREELEVVNEAEPQLSDGVWKCGNCSDISDNTKLLYTETLDLDTNDWDYGQEVQIGFSMNNMRCIVLETEAVKVRRVSGACAGDYVTLSILPKSHVEMKIYE